MEFSIIINDKSDLAMTEWRNPTTTSLAFMDKDHRVLLTITDKEVLGQASIFNILKLLKAKIEAIEENMKGSDTLDASLNNRDGTNIS